ncbi:MAG: hypothetical protein WC306_03670 [Candidatus Paceibacterota bacterium]
MPAGILNKNTILIFSNLESMLAYVPSGQNKIGIDSSTNNYYIYNGSKWVLFKEYVPASSTDLFPYYIPFTEPSYVYDGDASQSIALKNSIAETVEISKTKTNRFFSGIDTIRLELSCSIFNTIYNYQTAGVPVVSASIM